MRGGGHEDTRPLTSVKIYCHTPSAWGTPLFEKTWIRHRLKFTPEEWDTNTGTLVFLAVTPSTSAVFWHSLFISSMMILSCLSITDMFSLSLFFIESFSFPNFSISASCFLRASFSSFMLLLASCNDHFKINLLHSNFYNQCFSFFLILQMTINVYHCSDLPFLYIPPLSVYAFKKGRVLQMSWIKSIPVDFQTKHQVL